MHFTTDVKGHVRLVQHKILVFWERWYFRLYLILPSYLKKRRSGSIRGLRKRCRSITGGRSLDSFAPVALISVCIYDSERRVWTDNSILSSACVGPPRLKAALHAAPRTGAVCKRINTPLVAQTSTPPAKKKKKKRENLLQPKKDTSDVNIRAKYMRSSSTTK